jgi:uncharacterized protein YdeI (YjbR/CyaY-like superfamily)
MSIKDQYPRVPIESRAQLRTWLTQNHDRCDGVWLVRSRKAARPDRYVSQADIAREGLCFGWIDSQIRRLDDERNLLLFTPRRKGSMWSKVNKQFVVELTAAGLLTPAGQAVIDAAKADGSWTVLDDVEALVVPPDLAEALATTPGAQAGYNAWPDSAKKIVLWGLKSAKRPATRARRLAGYVQKAVAGERPQ